jgi:hypothetical protein
MGSNGAGRCTVCRTGAIRLLEDEARALLSRLARVKSFALHETMVPAAAVSIQAQAAIEYTLARGRRELRDAIHAYIRWLRSDEAASSALSELHRRFALLRLRFNVVLGHFDLFAIVMTQRSEHETGVWLSGLDVAATDALRLPNNAFIGPPVICYLDRGLGAAIRRAKTRLPGGGENPVAIIRLPRERMIGSGVASSLVHEVGHQAAALLDLVTPLRVVLDGLGRTRSADAASWQLWSRWISEIVADFWAVGQLGIAATLGLMGVLSLPRPFVFRAAHDDPHPTPWIRVRLSCAMGAALYPDPQWARLSATWASFYPPNDLDERTRRTFEGLERTMPAFVSVLLNHRARKLNGVSLAESMPVAERKPSSLRALLEKWRPSLDGIRAAAPSLAFAVIGQARADRAISTREESRLLAELLTGWALRSTIDASVAYSARFDASLTRPAAPAATTINRSALASSVA